MTWRGCRTALRTGTALWAPRRVQQRDVRVLVGPYLRCLHCDVQPQRLAPIPLLARGRLHGWSQLHAQMMCTAMVHQSQGLETWRAGIGEAFACRLDEKYRTVDKRSWHKKLGENGKILGLENKFL